MKIKALCFISLFVLYSTVYASPVIVTPHIKIDQFGYFPGSKKVAVIVDPQVGYNAAEFFVPGTATNQYQVRRWADDGVVLAGTLTVWNNGATHVQSGDKGWWFDFSSLTTPGSYYIFDIANNVGSYRFEIGNQVYEDVLKQAVRMFFYQRINYAKQIPYVDAQWTDPACFEGSMQDRSARSGYDKANPATARDLYGGWMDAGDYNKYTTFTLNPLCNLLETFRMHPAVFRDDYNIPESGNGIPDMLDEVSWELDWLKRMQDATGTNGLLLKVGVDNYNVGYPPSTDNNPRYYVPECTSSTLTGAAVFALAGIVYKSVGTPATITYGNDLVNRAVNAWARAKITTSNFTSFSTTCDDQDIKAGDADVSTDDQKEMIVIAAAYLFEATGSIEYLNQFDNMYMQTRPYSYWWWGPYYTAVQRAMLRYSLLPGATSSVAANIRSMKEAQNGILSSTDYTGNTDLYRAHLPDDQYHWGSNEVKANAGNHNLDFVSFSLNAVQSSMYKEIGESYLHWFHGVNPMGKVMLTNMYAYGGDDCLNEMYHSWFQDGSNWDNLKTSFGPPPGYMPVGPNKFFPVSSITPPYGQPAQKSFKEWNTGWNGSFNENSWEITEPTIYGQAAYISLLARVMGNASAVILPLHVVDIRVRPLDNGNRIVWEVAHPNNSMYFEVERSLNGRDYLTISRKTSEPGRTEYTVLDTDTDIKKPVIYYRVKETDESGGIFYSKLVRVYAKQKITIRAYPNPVSEKIKLTGFAEYSNQMTVTIVDAGGKMVHIDTWQQTAGNFSRNIDAQTFPKGIYWLYFNGGISHAPIQVVKQ